MSPAELTLLIGTPAVVVVCIARCGAYRKQGHTGPVNPAGLRPTDWRYRVDQRGHLHVTITDYGLTQRRSRSYKFAPGTPDSAVPMEARYAVRKARRDANWR